jgi:putative serine protease PepD
VTTPWDQEPGPTPPGGDGAAGPPDGTPASPAAPHHVDPAPSAPLVPPTPPTPPPAVPGDPGRAPIGSTAAPIDSGPTTDPTPLVPPAPPAESAVAPSRPWPAPPRPERPWAGDSGGFAPPSSPPTTGVSSPPSGYGSPPSGYSPPIPPFGAGSSSYTWGAASVPPTPPPSSPSFPPRRSGGRVWLVLAALIVALALVTAGYLAGDVASRNNDSGALGDPASATSTSQGPTTPLVQGSSSQPVVAVATALKSAVVQIQTQSGLGSGIIYNGSGLIVTNAHVVGSSTDVQVTLANGKNLDGHVVGADPGSDVAVVRVDPGDSKLVAAKLATTEPQVGSVTVAIGSPFGLSGTVTSGVVSAVDRPLDNGSSINMIQTDAAINPGNSGGALANINGEVIGVNAEILSESGDNNGIGFAIPIQTAMAIATKITSGQSLVKPAVGVSVQDDPNGSEGAYVAKVTPGGPADKAGVKQGDLIVALDGHDITSAGDFVDQVIGHAPGQSSVVQVQRDGKVINLTVTYTTSGGN